MLLFDRPLLFHKPQINSSPQAFCPKQRMNIPVGLISHLWRYISQHRCKHPEVIGQECLSCGYDLGACYGMPLDYIHKGLRLSHEEAARIRQDRTKDLLMQRKLHLVLDIDHTLVHAVQLENLKPEEITYLKKENAASLRDSLVNLESLGMVVKFRPFLHTFLKEASSLFEIYLYTRGTRCYARSIALLLDPQGLYFADRIISREDTPTKYKSLELVIAQDRAVLIVDDTESIWPNDKKNLILVEKYYYFDETTNVGYLKRESDESEADGGLATMLRVLRELHERFFKQVDQGDIRLVMESVRRSMLEGCKIHVAFSPFNDGAEVKRVYKMAKELGAKCSTKLDSSMTHVIAFKRTDSVVEWAVEMKKFLVSPWWIEAQYFSWRRQPEVNFPVNGV